MHLNNYDILFQTPIFSKCTFYPPLFLDLSHQFIFALIKSSRYECKLKKYSRCTSEL